MSNIPEAYSIDKYRKEKLNELFLNKENQDKYKSLWKINNDLLYYLSGNKGVEYFYITFWDGSTKGEANNPDSEGYRIIYVILKS